MLSRRGQRPSARSVLSRSFLVPITMSPAAATLSVLCLLVLSAIRIEGSSKDLTSDKVCPRGFFGNNGVRPCTPCPKGYYGLESGLSSDLCSAACPTGRYNDKVGAISQDDCRECPRNSYSSSTGTTSQHCTPCDAGKFHTSTGQVSASACLTCEPGYLDNACQFEETLEMQGLVT